GTKMNSTREVVQDYGDAKQTRSPEPPPSTGDQPMQGAPQESGGPEKGGAETGNSRPVA
ncbi:hypothetical protein CU097_000892, partial [Rhizopus azygosporus]